MEALILICCLGALALLGSRSLGGFAKPFLVAIGYFLLLNGGSWLFLHVVLGVSPEALYWISMLTVPLSLVIAGVIGYRAARGGSGRERGEISPKQVFGTVLILLALGFLYFAGVPGFLSARLGLTCSPLVPSPKCTAAEAVKTGNIGRCRVFRDISQQDECRRIFASKAPGPESCGSASSQTSTELAICMSNYKGSEKFEKYCEEQARADRVEALVVAGCGRNLAAWASSSTGRNLFLATVAYNQEKGARVSALCASQLRELVSYGVSADARDRDGNTAWHFANFPCFEELLRKHANLLNAQNNKGETPLMVLLQDRGPAFLSPHRLKTMVDAGMAIGIVDSSGQTALHHLMKNRRLHDPSELARALVALGADPDAKDASGGTPRQLALDRGLDDKAFHGN